MEDPRCRNCDAMLAEGAEWCNQCFTPIALADPPAAAPAVIVAEPPVTPQEPLPEEVPAASIVSVSEEDTAEPAAASIDPRLDWACPTCGEENPLTLTLCAVCGTPFGKLFEEQKRVEMDPSRAAALGLLPGYAIIKMGDAVEGWTRAIVAMLTALTVFFFIGPGWGVSRILIMALYLLFSVFVVVESSMSSRRLAENRSVVISGRLLLYMFAGVFGASVLLIVMLSATVGRE